MTDKFYIAPLPPDTRPPPGSIAHGSLDAVMELLPGTRARDAALQIFADAATARVAADERITQAQLREAEIEEQRLELQQKQVALLSKGLDKLSARMDALEGERREQEVKQIVDYLDSLADPDDPNPGGELSPIRPASRAENQLPDPDDPSGASLKMDSPPSGNKITRPMPDPEDLGSYENPEYPQPASTSMW
jgi:hypothetical protein